LPIQLRAARGAGSYEKRMLRFTSPDVLAASVRWHVL
jgi:hypothetical protein